MRISRVISLVALICFQGACGDISERRYIDESTLRQNHAVANTSPFHSRNGWASLVEFHVEASAPDHIVEASIAAADSWNDAVGIPLLHFVGIIVSERGSTLFASLDDDDTVIYYERNWLDTTDKPSTTLATTVWENDRRSDSILRADIILNAEIYLFQDSTIDPLDADRKNVIVDAETVVLHEFGHLLGLDHVSELDDENSVMHAKTFIGPQMHSRNLSDGDRWNIRSIYD